MKEKLLAFIDGLIVYDYILFGVSFILFILFIILALLLRKRLFIALFFVLLGFATLMLGPTLGYMQMHKYLFKNSTKILSQKKLNFVEAVVVKATLTNESKFDFSECKITAKVYKVSKNKYKNYLFKLKPLKKMSILEYDLPKGQTRELKIIIEPFKYKKDYNISLGAECK
jgi:predicted membrane protein